VKMSVDWHKDCLKNWTRSIDQDEKRALQLMECVTAARKKISFYESQIARAEKEGREGFDENKFNVKSSPRS
jgi:hypothetical protein